MFVTIDAKVLSDAATANTTDASFNASEIYPPKPDIKVKAAEVLRQVMEVLERHKAQNISVRRTVTRLSPLTSFDLQNRFSFNRLQLSRTRLE